MQEIRQWLRLHQSIRPLNCDILGSIQINADTNPSSHALLRRRLNQSRTLNVNLGNDAERGEETTTSSSTTTSRSVQTSNDNKNEKVASNNADNMAIKSPPSKKRTRTKNEESAHSTRTYRQKIAHNESCEGGSTNTKKASNKVTTTDDESVADIGEESVRSKKPHWMQVCESMPQSDIANNGENLLDKDGEEEGIGSFSGRRDFMSSSTI